MQDLKFISDIRCPGRGCGKLLGKLYEGEILEIDLKNRVKIKTRYDDTTILKCGKCKKEIAVKYYKVVEKKC